MRYFVFIVFIAFAFSASSQSVPKKLIGKWQWIESSGGMAGEILNPQTEKYEMQIEFTKKGRFTEWKDQKTTASLKYMVKNGKSIHSKEPQPIITYIPKPNSKSTLMSDSFEFYGNDTLMLKTECYDCYARLFIRKKK
jgi:hypothetical protein